MSNKTQTMYLIYCRTGCTCCSNENHYRGPYKTLESATSAVEAFKSIPLLSSQYSATGIYEIHTEEGEILPDGRIIIDWRVCAGYAEDTGVNYLWE